ncbi:hypothetical protein [Thermomonospora sp. CIF 1]|uniref:hypothetical protein n=1 Tax=Thermomonospora sp. CIF 1 TaxID=1916083 RepID=UPI000CC979F3|nr:hypothetical protein [Thermomonospora sp. CIF 1]PKK15561.1 MAG: hypothetical protein BUE48_004465 [Thermomonospora sp. CIF 1]
MPDVTWARLDGFEAIELLEECADLYVQVYAEPPYNGAPKFSRDRFLSRTRRQMTSAGFTMVTARRDGVLVGFAFGFSMAAGSWWANASPCLREDHLSSALPLRRDVRLPGRLGRVGGCP